jgi:DNA-binding NtrC family response regulator
VRRLGGKSEFAVDVQVLASTNKDPQEAVRKGELRMDLYYRLNLFHIRMPPLRERKEDLPLLAEALLATLNQKYGCRVTDVSAEVLELFGRHDWPGNVRELRNVLARAVILAGEGSIRREHLPPALSGLALAAPPAAGSESGLYVPLGSRLRDVERELIERTLAYAGNNKTRAAAMLGIGLKTLHNKLKLYRKSSAGSLASASGAGPWEA